MERYRITQVRCIKLYIQNMQIFLSKYLCKDVLSSGTYMQKNAQKPLSPTPDTTTNGETLIFSVFVVCNYFYYC